MGAVGVAGLCLKISCRTFRTNGRTFVCRETTLGTVCACWNISKNTVRTHTSHGSKSTTYILSPPPSQKILQQVIRPHLFFAHHMGNFLGNNLQSFDFSPKSFRTWRRANLWIESLGWFWSLLCDRIRSDTLYNWTEHVHCCSSPMDTKCNWCCYLHGAPLDPQCWSTIH